MRLPRRTPLLLPAVGIFSLLAMTTAAADSTTTALPNLSSAAASESAAATATTASATTDSTAAASSGATATSSGITITATGTADSTTGTVPSITGGSTGASLSSGLPKLSSAYTILPASVPPTSNAPFMQTSSLPDGSVFIIVGAIMGFFALSVLLWRALVAWSLHRSVKRANQHQYAPMTDAKAAFRAPPAPFYKYTDRPDSMISLSGIAGKGGRRGAGRPTTPSGPAASLFFSPTAGAVSNAPGNRGSNYLPAGYYAAGASAPPNMTSVGGSPYQHQSNMSMSNVDGTVRPQSRGSPSWGAQNPNVASGSTLNLSHSPGDQRTPSVYLEDLMDGSGLGTPPPPPPPHRQSQYGRPF